MGSPLLVLMVNDYITQLPVKINSSFLCRYKHTIKDIPQALFQPVYPFALLLNTYLLPDAALGDELMQKT